MKNNFTTVATVVPKINLGRPIDNVKPILTEIKKMATRASIIVTPELCLTGYTLSDIFFQKQIIADSQKALEKIINSSKQIDCLFTVGFPLEYKHSLFNCVAVIFKGACLGIVPKTYIPNYQEYYEKRHFESGQNIIDKEVNFSSFKNIPFGTNLLFYNNENKDEIFGVEICEDMFAPISPSSFLTLAGATIILNSSASIETINKDIYRKTLINSISGSKICGYVYANAGTYESTTDAVFSGHSIISENGTILKENKEFSNENLIADIDLSIITHDRKVISSFKDSKAHYGNLMPKYKKIPYSLKKKTKITRAISSSPFVPANEQELKSRAEKILSIQKFGIIKRMQSANTSKLVVGLSGGLDSCLAFLSMVEAMRELNLPLKNITAVSMPCFGTTKRTKTNAQKLANSFNVKFLEIDITKTVKSHLKDINHSLDNHSIVFENAQARVRTLTLFDIANQSKGLLIGTGDLSELSLGFATYGGDHISSYGVNAGIPKTLVRFVIKRYIERLNDYIKLVRGGAALQTQVKTLLDILDTPVSPELLPPIKGKIAQKTEEIVGPYELNDFFLYHFLRFGKTKEQILELTKLAFKKKYSLDVIKCWLNLFYKRFFANQFKRSCLPDGIKVGSVSLSPRADFRMPSDL